MRKAYQSDLSDTEWSCLERLLPVPHATGRLKTHSTPEVLNAIFYIVRGGCAWRLLPNDFPPWKTVYHYFRSWRLDGTWERMHAALRKRVRVRLERYPQPSAAIADSQSVKTTGVGGEERGYDGGKKVKGRKRHLLVDTQGFVLEVRVHSAKVMDRDGIKLLLEPSSPDRLSRLSQVWLDAGYNGQDKGADWVQKVLGWTAEIVRHPPKPVPEEVMRTWAKELTKEGIEIDRQKLREPKYPRTFLPKRWVVERTFSWLGQNRRLTARFTEGGPHRMRHMRDLDKGFVSLAEVASTCGRVRIAATRCKQRLRASAGERRSVHLRGYEPPDGEEIGSLMRVFRQFQGELLRITLPKLSKNY